VKPSTGRNDPCPCGSGRKFKHCHGNKAAPPAIGGAQAIPLLIQAQRLLVQGNYNQATTILRRALELDASNVDAQHFMGMATAFGGKIGEGIERIRASVNAQPNNPLFRFNLAFWLGKTGNVGAAIRELIQAVAVKPDYHEARYQLVKLAMERRMHALAKLHLDALLAVEPENPELHYRLATVLLRLKEHTAMEREFRTLIARAPDNIELHMKLGEGLRGTGRDDEARAEYETVLAIEPGNPDALYELALLEERRHRLEESERLARQGLALQPNHGFLQLALARVRRRQGRMEEALEMLRQIASANVTDGCRVSAFYEMGTILDKLKRYDEAFEAFDHANIVDRNQFTDLETGTFYNKDANKAWFTTLKNFYTRDRLAALQPYLPPPASGPQPLFIVGFPRSGTTLTEQMLSAHPHIHGGDELTGLGLIEQHAATQTIQNLEPYPACLAAVPQTGKQDTLFKLRDFYLHIAAESQAVDPEKPLFTDKMPLNENHMGLIRLLFPASPIIHVVRHPLDIVLSCYTNQLYHGNACALSLDTLAFHMIETWKLVDHYTVEMDLRYTRIRYEDLLNDPEGEIRRVLEFIGEPWDARCLDFHKSGRVARTASYAQVSQPLYRSSQERWRAYRKHLAPIIPVLAPLVERLGYSLE
jgi:tetratricopeptide (TPR) repeat protein